MKQFISPIRGLITMGLVAGAGSASAQYFSTDNLMPSPHYHGETPVLFGSSGIQLNSIDIDISNGRVSPPTGGGQRTSNFFDIFLELSMSSGGSTNIFAATANGQIDIQDAGNGNYDTEMVKLDISGGTLPAGARLRESPTEPSRGKSSLAATPGGFMVSSFFDVFTELSLDGGQTWTPSSGSERMVGSVPEPASFVVIGLGLVGMAVKRRKSNKA
jgi:hypothetical protein